MSARNPDNPSALYTESLPGANVMVDGYIGGRGLTNAREDHVNPFQNSCNFEFLREKRQSDVSQDDLTHQTRFNLREQKATFHLKEYNSQYNGLTIIPWEDFASNPTQLNDLFHLEKTGFITFDPEEVNVFFHATRMNKPALGEISENGGAWVLAVENAHQLDTIRLSLTERLSVFGLTLVRKGKGFKQKHRAPCLLMVDPTDGVLGEQINAQLTKCEKIMDSQGKFCLEITFNGSVERWCRKVTGTKCTSVGAKLIVTNGDEPENLRRIENILCCVACFPIWAIQTAIIKLHREIAYEDILLEFNAEEILLHGSVGGVQNQRQHLFRENTQNTVFYTKQIQSPTEDLGYKYICLKKYDKNNFHAFDENSKDKNQYETTSIYRCFGDKHQSFPSTTAKKQNSEERFDMKDNEEKLKEPHISRLGVDTIHGRNQMSTIPTLPPITPPPPQRQQYKQQHEQLKESQLPSPANDSTKEQESNNDVTEVESISQFNVVHSNISDDEFSNDDPEIPVSPVSKLYQSQRKETSERFIKVSKNNNDFEDVDSIAESDEIQKDEKVETDNKCEAFQGNNESDITISDLESESATETDTSSVLNTNYPKQPVRHHIRRRQNPRYDSKRKYLSAHAPKLKIK